MNEKGVNEWIEIEREREHSYYRKKRRTKTRWKTTIKESEGNEEACE